ncbi:MAG: hypothetical protein JO267_03075 [Alphaproteobacteria bacterium]|nr:hypothetical protein [Alphaproteobacteria bacterium]
MADDSQHRLLRGRDIEFDLQHGLDTDDRLEVEEFSIEKRWQSERYLPAYVDLLLALEPVFPKNLADFIFIDIGAGKGRAVLIASHFPFKKVIGVEFVPELFSVMKSNIQKYHDPRQRCNDIEPILADATEYDFPAEKLVLFLFNPMARAALERFVDNLHHSLLMHPRELRVLFLNPNLANAAEELLQKTGIFTIREYRAPEFAAVCHWRLLVCDSSIIS